MPAAVAIAVVSWNTRELLAECLTSLHADAEAGLTEVWVVDNASSDGSADLVREEFPWVHLEASEENLGFGPAVNVVAQRTSTPWVAPANSDLRFEPGAIQALIDAGDTDRHAGALAPRLVMPNGQVQHSVHPFPTPRVGLLLSTGLALRAPFATRLPMEGSWDTEAGRYVDWAHGAFLLCRREAWDAIDGFDDEQWMYAEDLDLCWRLAQEGWRTRYVPDSVVHHHVSAATASRWDAGERAVRTQRSAYAWMLRRQGTLRTRTTALAHLAGPAARWVSYAAGAKVRPGRYAAKRDRQRVYVAMHRTGLEPASTLLAHRSRGS